MIVTSEDWEALLKSRDHWKANHDNAVRRARVLIDRTDVPLERVRAYNYILELEAKIDSLKARVAELEVILKSCESALDEFVECNPNIKVRFDIAKALGETNGPKT